MAQENVEMVRRSYEAWHRGDFDAASEDSAPDIEFDMSRAIGTDRGIYSLSQARRLMEEFLEAFYRVQLGAEYIDAGEHVVIQFTNRFRGRDGIEVQARGAWLCTIRDGGIVRICLYQELQEALDAAGLSEWAMSKENVEKVQAAIKAWNRSDLGMAFKDLAHDVELDVSSNVGEWRGIYRGTDAVRGFWRKYFIDPWESVRAEIDEVIEADQHHVVTRQTGYFLGRDGIEVTAETAWCWTFRDGQVTRLLISNELTDALEASGGRE